MLSGPLPETRWPVAGLSEVIPGFSAPPTVTRMPEVLLPEVLPVEFLPPKIRDLDEAVAAHREGDDTLPLSEFAYRHMGQHLDRRQLARLKRELFRYEELAFQEIYVCLDHPEWWLDENAETKRTESIRAKIKLFPSLDKALHILADRVEIEERVLSHKKIKERVLREEIEEVVCQKAARLFSDEDLVRGVTNYIRREGRKLQNESSRPPVEVVELAAFADREKTLKQAKDAGLPPREYELFKLRVVKNPGISLREAAQHMGIAEGTAKSLWSKIKRTLNAA